MPASPPPHQEVDHFEYEPLDLEDTTLRLVRLQKEDTGQIECELLHTFFLKDEAFVEYEALSYTWGGSEQPRSIILNGKHMAVTENLYHALRLLRNPEQDRILWIDALCIDQQNVKERGHQVRQMPVIYRNALRVIIWLGLATPAEDQAMRGMKCLENAMKTQACGSWRLHDRRWLIMWKGVKDNASRVDERALYSLLNQSWFTRVWIIQEVTNARAARIYCGTESVSTRTFIVMLLLAGIDPSPHCQAILDVMPGPSRKNSWWSTNPNLGTLLYKFRNCKASDSRDYVYGLLGVSPDFAGAASLVPDNGKSDAEIVHEAMAVILGVHDRQELYDLLPNWTMSQLRCLANDVDNLFPDFRKEAAKKNTYLTTCALLRTGKITSQMLLDQIRRRFEQGQKSLSRSNKAVLWAMTSEIAVAEGHSFELLELLTTLERRILKSGDRAVIAALKSSILTDADDAVKLAYRKK